MKYSNMLGEYIRFRKSNAGFSLNKFDIETEIELSALSGNETKSMKLALTIW